jgi:hypothetical protein
VLAVPRSTAMSRPIHDILFFPLAICASSFIVLS